MPLATASLQTVRRFVLALGLAAALLPSAAVAQTWIGPLTGSRYPLYKREAAQVFIGGPWSPSVADDQFWSLDVTGLNFQPTIAAPPFATGSMAMIGAYLGPQFSTAPSGSHSVYGVVVDSPPITVNGTSVLEAVAALYVENVYSYATAIGNYAIWSAGGRNRFDGASEFRSPIDLNAASNQLALGIVNKVTFTASGLSGPRTLTVPDVSGTLVTSAAGAVEIPEAGAGVTLGSAQPRSAYFTSAASVMVAQVPAQITSVPGSARGALYIVHGDDGAGNAFADLVYVVVGSGPNVVFSGTSSGTPAARAYSMTGTALKLSVASGAYSVSLGALAA